MQLLRNQMLEEYKTAAKAEKKIALHTGGLNVRPATVVARIPIRCRRAAPTTSAKRLPHWLQRTVISSTSSSRLSSSASKSCTPFRSGSTFARHQARTAVDAPQTLEQEVAVQLAREAQFQGDYRKLSLLRDDLAEKIRKATQGGLIQSQSGAALDFLQANAPSTAGVAAPITPSVVSKGPQLLDEESRKRKAEDAAVGDNAKRKPE